MNGLAKLGGPRPVSPSPVGGVPLGHSQASPQSVDQIPIDGTPFQLPAGFGHGQPGLTQAIQARYQHLVGHGLQPQSINPLLQWAMLHMGA